MSSTYHQPQHEQWQQKQPWHARAQTDAATWVKEVKERKETKGMEVSGSFLLPFLLLSLPFPSLSSSTSKMSLPALSSSSVAMLLAGTLDSVRVKECEHSLAHLRTHTGFYSLILVCGQTVSTHTLSFSFWVYPVPVLSFVGVGCECAA